MVAGLCGALLVGGVVGWAVYRELTANLPPVDKLLGYQLPVASRVYADDGTLLGEFFIEKRYLVPLANIPPLVRDAFLAAEDASFYRHKGVDFLGIARAAIANFSAGEVVQGGSTITQQVVKALLLSPEKSYERKAKEILLALRLERQLSKDEILYLYLNLIYLGNGAYGVGAAAQEYFGKEVSTLTLAEAALLAGLPQAPSRYSPLRHWDRAKHRQRYVLEQMARNSFVSWEDAEQALQAQLQLTQREAQSPAYLAAPFFVEHVRRMLEDRYGGSAPYQAGLKVYTTVNLPMQRAAEQAIRKGLDKVDEGRTRGRPLRRLSNAEAQRFLASAQKTRDTASPEPGRSYQALVLGPAAGGQFRVQVNRFTGLLGSTPEHPLPPGLARNDVLAVRRQPGPGEVPQFTADPDPQLEGGLVSIEPATGFVKAMVGGYDFQRSQFNRVTQALRQPGSAFKPFVYAAALDHGYTAASVIVDAPIVLTGGSQAWMPQNYDEKFNGPTTLRNALAQSRNVVTVKLAQNIGLNYLVGYLPRFGFAHPFAKNLSIALGSAEVTLLELARAYTVFTNQGRRVEPLFITRITDPHGRVLEEFTPHSDPVLSPETAYIVTSMLKSVVERGTGRRVQALGRPVAGKTGTTNDMHDAWFVGYTPDLLTGVWVGYDSERSLGKEQTGGRVAAPIFLEYMQAALAGSPVTDFPVPDGITLVSIKQGSGQLASASSQDAFLECFKRGSEPQQSETDDASFDDELGRAVARLRGPGGETAIGEAAPALVDGGSDGDRGDDWDDTDPETVPRARGFEGQRLDDRPPPRAEDYLGGPRNRPAPRPEQQPRRNQPSDPGIGGYRQNDPRPRRGIIEEQLD